MQRIKIQATVRRGREADLISTWLAGLARDAGAVNVRAHGAAKKRGGGVQVVADATDARVVMNALRAKLDADVNAYALDVLNELQIGAFESDAGGFLGFVNEDYRVSRD